MDKAAFPPRKQGRIGTSDRFKDAQADEDRPPGACSDADEIAALRQSAQAWAEAAEHWMNRHDALRAVLAQVRRDIEETADDAVWMRGGIETVCDRISSALGDRQGA